jgi:hypothetical protein
VIAYILKTANCGGAAYIPSTWETEDGELKVPGQPKLQSKILSQKKTTKNKK